MIERDEGIADTNLEICTLAEFVSGTVTVTP
jgi:hypothetical protein